MSNILITSAGRRVSLVKLFKSALQSNKTSGKVIAIDMSKSAPALYVADNFRIVCSVHDKNYLGAIKKICCDFDIKLIVPTIDTELVFLSQHKEYFQEIGAKVLVSGFATNIIFLDKFKTANFFLQNKIPCPRIYSKSDALSLASNEFPLIIKPILGSAGNGVFKAKNKNELIFYLENYKDIIIQEFIDGEEFTIDAYFDFKGNVRCAVPRRRLEVRSGEVSKSVTSANQMIIDYSYKVLNLIKDGLGCITLQCFLKNDGDLCFIEINPRFGGGFPLSAAAGANFPEWIIRELNDLALDNNLQEIWEDKLAMLRYDAEIFLDNFPEN